MSNDRRFAYAFTSDSGSFYPIQILQLQQLRLGDTARGVILAAIARAEFDNAILGVDTPTDKYVAVPRADLIKWGYFPGPGAPPS